MSATLKFAVKTDLKPWVARMRAIGSREIPQAIQFAVDETAKWAVFHFRDDVMPDVLGHRKGESWRPGSAGKCDPWTRKGIDYDRRRQVRYGSIKAAADIKPASISVRSEQ